MTQVTSIGDLKGHLEPEQVEKLMALATNLRDALLIKVADIDFENRAIAIKVQKKYEEEGKHEDLHRH